MWPALEAFLVFLEWCKYHVGPVYGLSHKGRRVEQMGRSLVLENQHRECGKHLEMCDKHCPLNVPFILSGPELPSCTASAEHLRGYAGAL